MADRYWVGGTGTWTKTSTTNWSATSGGAGGASAPTATDNVIFDSATTYTVTVSGIAGDIDCLSLTVSAGTVTFSSTSTPYVNVYGSFNIKTGTSWTVSTLRFRSTTTGNTITPNGVTLTSAIVFDGVGGGWTLAGALTCTSITWTNGTFNTANYAVTISSILGFRTATGTKTINLGSSTLTSSAVGTPNADFVNFGSTTGDAGLTLNAGTSSLVGPASGTSNFYGSGKTFYNVTFRGAVNYSGVGTPVYGANTFNNLTFPGASGNIYTQVTLYADQTVNGTLTIGSSQSSANGGAALLFKSSGLYTDTKYTVTAAAVSILCVTFQNITAAGSAVPWTGTNVGNGGGNTNITFTAAKTVYWSLAAGGTYQEGTSGSIAFATSSGGAPARTNFPLVQDTVIIDNAGLTTGNSIQFNGNGLICNVNCTRTNAWNFNASAAGSTVNMYGSLTLTSVTSTTAYPVLNWNGATGIKTVTFNGGLPTALLYVSCAPASGIQFGGPLTNTLSTFYCGTIHFGGQTWTQTTADWSTNWTSTAAKTVTAAGGNLTLTGSGATIFTYRNAVNVTLTDTININSTYSGSVGTRTFLGPSVGGISTSTTYPQTDRLKINITAGSDTVNWNAGSSTQYYGTWDFTGFSGTLSQGTYAGNYLTSLILSSSMSFSATPALYFSLAFYGPSASITSSGKTFPFALNLGSPHNVGYGNLTLNDAFSSVTTLQFGYGTAGTPSSFNTNNYACTLQVISFAAGVYGTISLGSSTLTLTGSGTTTSSPLSLLSTTTLNAGTSTISLNSSSTKGVYTTASGLTLYNVVQSGTGTLILYNNNTYNSLTNTVQPSTVQFGASTTHTFGTFGLSGTAGNLTSITSTTAGTRYTLTKPSGTVSPTYLSIQDSNATGGATWDARGTGNVDAGNNLGWLFSSFGKMLLFFE